MNCESKPVMAWKVYDGPQISPIFSGIVCMVSASDRLIAVITEDETPVDPSTWSDIVRLIAAAPDMLAALRNIAEGNLGDASWQANYDKIREVASAAIAEAEGIPY